MSTTPHSGCPQVSTEPARLASLAGLVYAVLMIASIAISGGETPDFDAPLEDWTTFAKEEGDGLRLSVAVFGVAVVAFGLFLRGLATTLERPVAAARNTSTVVVGGVLGVTGILLGLTLSAIGSLHTDTSPDVIRAMSDLSGAGFVIAAPAFALMMVSVFLLARDTRALPAWLSYVALACGLFFLLQLGTLLSDEFDNAFGIFYPLAFLLLLVFTIGTSVVGLRRAR